MYFGQGAILMQKCQFCGAEMPDNARFCGTCGRVQDDNSAPESATIRSSTAYPSWYSDNSAMPETQAPPPPPPSNPGWPTPSGQQWTPNSQYPNTNPSQDNQQAGTYPAYMPYRNPGSRWANLRSHAANSAGNTSAGL